MVDDTIIEVETELRPPCWWAQWRIKTCVDGGVNHELSNNTLSRHIVLALAYLYRGKASHNYQTLHHQGKTLIVTE